MAYQTEAEQTESAGGSADQRVIAALAALAQPHRLAMIRLLVRQPAEGMPAGLPAGLLAERLGLAANTASFHLAQLHQAGLVRSTRQGRQVVYRVELSALVGLTTYLLEECCGGAGCAGLPPIIPCLTNEDQ